MTTNFFFSEKNASLETEIEIYKNILEKIQRLRELAIKHIIFFIYDTKNKKKCRNGLIVFALASKLF
jgi:hypothetical protein